MTKKQTKRQQEQPKKWRTVAFTITGTKPYMQHKWNPKAMRGCMNYETGVIGPRS